MHLALVWNSFRCGLQTCPREEYVDRRKCCFDFEGYKSTVFDSVYLGIVACAKQMNPISVSFPLVFHCFCIQNEPGNSAGSLALLFYVHCVFVLSCIWRFCCCSFFPFNKSTMDSWLMDREILVQSRASYYHEVTWSKVYLWCRERRQEQQGGKKKHAFWPACTLLCPVCS